MSRPAFVIALAVGLLPVSVGAADAPRPNVVLCMADDQGWGDVGYNSGFTALKTPTLDHMAASGLRFDRFYAAAPVCSPTRGSVLTGRHPNRFGCFSWGHTLRPQEVTLADALAAGGYATGHFGKWHVGPVRAGHPLSPGGRGFGEWVSSPNFYENDPLMSHNGRVVQLHGESSRATVEAALPFLRASAKAGKPFLAVIWFGNPHTPHVPVPELAKLYDDQPAAVRNYLAEITGVDRAMGLLRDELTALGVRDNTLLWYTSDNGAADPGSTGGLRGKKATLWEGGVRVPGIVEWPARVKAPRRTDLPCGTVDIYPTVLAAAGMTPPRQPPLDGASLLPLFDGTPTARPSPLGFWVYPEAGKGVTSAKLLTAMKAEERDGKPAGPNGAGEAEPWSKAVPADDRRGHAAWVDGRHKLHRIPPAKGVGDVRYELYDVVADPKEGRDLAGAEPDRVAKMRAGLEAWQASVVRSLNGADYAAK